jgi:hypothetical protein
VTPALAPRARAAAMKSLQEVVELLLSSVLTQLLDEVGSGQ